MTTAASPATGAAPDAEVRIGLFAAFGAYFLWGVLPLYLKYVGFIPPMELMAYRIVWAVPFAALVIALRKQWPAVLDALRNRRLLLGLAGTAALIAVNWFVYVWAVANDRVLEASLGYFINPLLNVAAGVVLLKEKLRRAQGIAVALAAIGVVVLAFGIGALPWVSLTLAISFCAYGLCRKFLVVNAVPGLFIETLWLAPFMALYLVWLVQSGENAVATVGASAIWKSMLLGPVTVIPLALFAIAARRLKLSTLGLMQYLAPSGQFLLGLMFGEAFTLAHAICFGLIWTALIIFSWDAYRAQRAAIGMAAAAHPVVATAESGEERR